MQGFLEQAGIKGFWQGIQDICFPAQCLACGVHLPCRQPPLFCRLCRERVTCIREPFCTRCGRPFPKAAGSSHLCGVCLSCSWYFDSARSLVLYNDGVAGIIQKFKYHGCTAALTTFAALYEEVSPLWPAVAPGLIIPVPLHRDRLRQRGFNQALLLAQTFLPDCRSIIDAGVVERTRKTKSQAGLNGAERRKNIRNSFFVKNKERVVGVDVLLVDDVFTTGTTVNECARQLKNAGAHSVQVLTLARSLQ